MNPFEMVVLIVAMSLIASVFIKRGESRRRHGAPRDEAESQRLRQEVKELTERLHVLERITTERESSLSREIEELRDR